MRFLVHLRSNCSKKTWPAEFGDCLLDQLNKLSIASQETCQHIKSNNTLASNNECVKQATNDMQDIEYGFTKESLQEATRGEDKAVVVNKGNEGKELMQSKECPAHLYTYVNYTTEDDHLVLYQVPKDTGHILTHPEGCPTRQWQLNQLRGAPSLHQNSAQGVAAAVCVLAQSSDGKLLLTRRAKHMRTFPGVWVIPGGHVEMGESLETAGLRELLEETGVAATDSSNLQVLGLWESVYPAFLGQGDPQRQHVVVYMVVELPLSAHNITVKLDSSETEAGVWVGEELVSAVLHRRSELMPNALPAIVLNQTGESVAGEVCTSAFLSNTTTTTSSSSRLGSGTSYALRLWLQKRMAMQSYSQAHL